ncbi:hypothetical protein KRX19_06390 [Cardiobacteriaceae bacterium TAE3-ERU3]|nr:hypothetical protein [Cardiobacteriaceae bacterium TAE3-ERU3]
MKTMSQILKKPRSKVARHRSLQIASTVRSRGDLLFSIGKILCFSLACLCVLLLNITYASSVVQSSESELEQESDVVIFRDDYFIDASHQQPFKQKLDGLDDADLDQFILGRSFFSVPWVVAPSATTARDGLGPLFNANTCTSCHVDNGAGIALADNGQPLRALTFKLAQPAKQGQREKESLINYGDPVYGRQVAINGNGKVAPEALTRLKHHKKIVTFPDGEIKELTFFEPYLENMNYGPLDTETQFALRQAPALAGMNLISKTDPEVILAYADPDDVDGDGISGRPNWVYDIAAQEMRLGKYGWKASQPTVVQQTADAAAHDMGLTNPLFPEELCTPAQTDCLDAPRGRPTAFGILDLPQQRLDAIAFYVTSFKAPHPVTFSEQAKQGYSLFTSIGCSSCHRAQLTTKDGIKFAPYSDFLLHDMGEELADGRPEYLAQTTEWRTAPLWGVGARVRQKQRFLHDARAADPLEAILWHGGEADQVKQRFMALDRVQREALLTFLEAL